MTVTMMSLDVDQRHFNLFLFLEKKKEAHKNIFCYLFLPSWRGKGKEK